MMFDAARQPQHVYRPSEAFVTRSVIARGAERGSVDRPPHVLPSEAHGLIPQRVRLPARRCAAEALSARSSRLLHVLAHRFVRGAERWPSHDHDALRTARLSLGGSLRCEWPPKAWRGSQLSKRAKFAQDAWGGAQRHWPESGVLTRPGSRPTGRDGLVRTRTTTYASAPPRARGARKGRSHGRGRPPGRRRGLPRVPRDVSRRGRAPRGTPFDGLRRMLLNRNGPRAN